MKLLLVFNLAALAFVVVTNSGYVPELVPWQDPLTEYGIVVGNVVIGLITVCGWREKVEILRTANDQFQMILDRMVMQKLKHQEAVEQVRAEASSEE